MKIPCECGYSISDGSDALPQKGRLIPDQNWSNVCDAVDDLLGAVGSGALGIEQAQNQFRSLLGRASRNAYECRQCGLLYVDDSRHVSHRYRPDGGDGSVNIFAARD